MKWIPALVFLLFISAFPLYPTLSYAQESVEITENNETAENKKETTSEETDEGQCPLRDVERRKEQYLEEFGYMIFPMPISLPGIGDGWAFGGMVNNIANSYADIVFYNLQGDFLGNGYFLDEIHLLSKRLVLKIGGEDISKVAVMQYSKRGMNTDKDDYNNIEVANVNSKYGLLTATFFDRKLDFYVDYNTQSYELERIRDKEGEILSEFDDPEKQKGRSFAYGILWDQTDDRQDPRKGFRLDVNRKNSPPESDSAPDFYVLDYSATLYFPVGKISTLAFNYFRSDANVINEGETDRAKIAEEWGVESNYENCNGDEECEANQQIVDNNLAANQHGTATSLGGDRRLRSYPMDRYQGAHSVFYAAELRWNFTDEHTPFDIYIMRDVRTGIQLALFYEQGSVAEYSSKLRDEWRSSYGAGFRIVTGSGTVYRIDVATGEEDTQQTMIIYYPW